MIPSGEQTELAHGDQRVTVVEVGGGLRAYSAGGVDVLDGYPAGEMASSGRGQLLIPWPNRIADGRYELAGRTFQLPLTEPAKGHASHGLVRWLPWQVDRRSAGEAVVTCTVHPQPGYPWRLACTVAYRLDDAGLTVTMAVENRSDDEAPVGLGAHPYLAVGDGPVDAARLRVPAATRLLLDDRSVPTGPAPVDADTDLRSGPVLGGRVLDTPYTDLERDPDGLVRVRLSRPDGREVVLWADAAYDHLQVFTGDTLPADRRRRGVAVEPMTCLPNAFGTDPPLLAAGGTLSGSWGIVPG